MSAFESSTTQEVTPAPFVEKDVLAFEYPEEATDLEYIETATKEKISYPTTKRTYQRFYRAHKGNRDAALEGLLKTINWRIENKVDEIKEEDLYPYYYSKVTFFEPVLDKAGRPITCNIACRHNGKDRDMASLFKNVAYFLDKGVRTSSTEQITIIFVLSGLGLKNLDLEATKVLVDVLQSHYPESLGCALLVNAPFIFSAFWEIVRFWIDPVTVNKIKFVKSGDLHQYVDITALSDDIKQACKLPV